MIFEILFLTFFAFLAYWIYHDNFCSKKPPGLFRLPVIGTILQLGVDKAVPQHESFRKLSKKYGPITSIQLGMYPGVIFDDFETMKKLLNHELWVDRFWNSLFAERSFGKELGVIFISGDTWKEMRRFTMRTLRDFGYGKQKSMESVLEDEVKDLLHKIDILQEENSIVPIKHVFSIPVLNVLWSMVCSTRSPEDDVRLKELLDVVDEIARATPMASGILLPFPALRHLPFVSKFTDNDTIKKCNAQLQQYFRDILHRRRKEGASVYKNDPRDYIDVFLREIEHHKKANSSPNYYTDDAFIITTIDLFEAGAETTNNTLEFAFYYMLKHPRVQVKVQAEIDRVVGRNRLASSLDRAEMTYVVAVLSEVQRISNVVPMTVRAPTEDFWLDGYLIEKGAVCFFNLFSMHMDEDFWGDPETFRPERFLDSEGKLIPTKMQHVLPFGAGKRVCLGEALASATLFTYFTNVLQHFKLEKCGTDSEKVRMLGFTLTPAPYSAKITKR